MRGIYAAFYTSDAVVRFTPAYAGNIASSFLSFGSYSVHPRVCGEYFRNNFIISSSIGSTPRMRGIFDWCLEEMHYTRFNPAYAGNIIIIIIGIIHCQVQPRVCGEYRIMISTR